MKGTIVQQYGPIYGEPVNGTVFGRPNGSVYVPPSNIIKLTKSGTKITQYAGTRGIGIIGTYSVEAISQDLASNIKMGTYTDSACTTEFGEGRAFAAGTFNVTASNIGSSDTAPESGTSYYIRAILMNNNTPVAYSEILEVVGE